MPDATSRPGLTRRGVVSTTAATGTVAAAGVLTGRATAVGYTAVSYPKTPVPGVATRHLLSRFSYGVTPALVSEVDRTGGARSWFDQQLDPQTIDDSFADQLVGWWPALSRSPQEAWSVHEAGTYAGHEAMFDLARWALLRRVYSRRQVLEVMSEFWLNLLHVPALPGPTFPWRIDYEKTVRGEALGSFAGLLNAAITHPAMLIYLDGATSTAKAPNENLGRELLELHTVGRGGGYTESHVKDSARILTGWHVDIRGTWQPSYRTADHATGAVTVMDFTDANASADGRDLTRRYLTYLANHPATARRLAHRLAQTFVSDDPPPALVDRLAGVYLANNTAIKPVLLELVRSAAFAESVGDKVRTPAADVVASYRVLGVKVSRPTSGDSAANRILWSTQKAGQRVYAWPRPDGDPIVNDAWTGTSRILGSLMVHQTLAGRSYPHQDIRYRSPASWLPQQAIRFDALVDHLSRSLLARRSTDRLLKAACQVTDIGPRERITKDHALVRHRMPFLLSMLLDSPAHMYR